MNQAKELQFRMPAEWQQYERCWMGFPRHEPSWEKIGIARARLAYAAVARAIREFEPVTMIVHPEDLTLAAELLDSNIELMPLPINDSWLRDTGCTFVLNPQGQLAGIDWIHNAWGGNYSDYALDNKIAAFMIQATKAQGFQAPLVMEGGAFHVDGEGTVLTTKECLLNPNRNPELTQEAIEKALHDNLGTEKAIWLNQGLRGDETDGHVDEIACFIATGKVLCLITEDKSDENYDLLNENKEILEQARDAKGRRLEVHTVTQPEAIWLGGERLTLSYVNFYIANGGIIMPAFGQAEADQAAFAKISELFPGRKIRQIEALDVFAGGGGIHCITQQQPRSWSRSP